MDVNKSKRGFTLVELLAVIAILAILVVIALPNVINMFQGAKKGTFKTEVQTIMKQAQSTWVLDGGSAKCYYHLTGTENSSQLSLQGTELNYVLKIDSSGAFTKVIVSSTEYAYSSTINLDNPVVSANIVDADIYTKGVAGAAGTNFTTASQLIDTAPEQVVACN